ncbi:hypothetical protein ABZ614_04375 [Streptomyces sp. NPDC013178]|uniref:hypothetical protein n=1 Tax=Streptomyces sp. NPDC013178 TaxID=3155118 RepID=UPI0033DF6093
MGQHTTDEVYDKVTDVEQKLDNHSKSAVTTTHFDTKIKELKEAFEKGAQKKEEEEAKKWQDIAKETSPIKEFLAITKGADLPAKIILGATAVVAAVALIAGLVAKFKEITLAFTGRTRTLGAFGKVRPDEKRKPRYFGRAESGKWGMQPGEDPGAQQPNLPSVDQINAVKQAMGHLNAEIDTYRGKVRGLATPRAMKQMASAAKKLESAAQKHQAIDTLAGSINGLNRELRELAGTAG